MLFKCHGYIRLLLLRLVNCFQLIRTGEVETIFPFQALWFFAWLLVALGTKVGRQIK